MSDLLDRLVGSARNDQLCEPRYSRSTRRVIVTVQGVDFSIPLKKLDAAIEAATSLSEGTGALQMLLDGLLHARQKYGRTKKLRGDHHGREKVFYTLKYASAWAYVMLQQQMTKPAKQRLPSVLGAEQELSARDYNWKFLQPFERRVCMTAHLVEQAFGTARRREGLTKRIADLDNFDSRNWYRDYIKAYIRNVRRIVKKNPATLERLGNAYLRELFR